MDLWCIHKHPPFGKLLLWIVAVVVVGGEESSRSVVERKAWGSLHLPAGNGQGGEDTSAAYTPEKS